MAMGRYRKVSDQRQRSPRRNLRFPVRIWADELQGRGFTRDVSSSGLLIETTQILDLGTWLQVEIELARTDHVYYVSTCVVVRKEARHPQVRPVFTPKMGVRFLSPGEAMYDLGHDETAPRLGVDLRDPQALRDTYERDIKRGGLRVPCREVYEVGAEVVVPMLLPEPYGTIDCRCTVVRQYEDPPAIAVLLTEVDAVRARLLEIIRTL